MRFRGWLHVVAIGCLAGTMSVFAAGSPLIDAVKKQDVQAVRALLKQKVDINATEADGFTALHWAAQRNDLQLVDLLARRRRQRQGLHPLQHHAALSRRPERQRRDHGAPAERGRRPERDRAGRPDDADDGGAVGEGGRRAGCC